MSEYGFSSGPPFHPPSAIVEGSVPDSTAHTWSALCPSPPPMTDNWHPDGLPYLPPSDDHSSGLFGSSSFQNTLPANVMSAMSHCKTYTNSPFSIPADFESMSNDNDYSFPPHGDMGETLCPMLKSGLAFHWEAEPISNPEQFFNKPHVVAKASMKLSFPNASYEARELVMAVSVCTDESLSIIWILSLWRTRASYELGSSLVKRQEWTSVKFVPGSPHSTFEELEAAVTNVWKGPKFRLELLGGDTPFLRRMIWSESVVIPQLIADARRKFENLSG